MIATERSQLKAIKCNEALELQFPVTGYRTLPIPGVANGRLGVCFVKVTDIPGALDAFMEINPRVPNRTAKGILSGPVTKGILSTLRDTPEEMVLKNQGIYLLVQSTAYDRHDGDHDGTLKLTLADKGKHGIINGGHTYAAIREAIEQCSNEEEQEALQRAYVRFNIFQGIDADFVPEIAEGLNRSKQVDDPSLINLQGDFDAIRKVLRGVQGEHSIAYHQGDNGDIYISEVLVYLEMFNRARYSDRKHPNALYNRQALGLKYFSEDLADSASPLKPLMAILPELLRLGDSIRKLTPEAANKNHLKFGRIKVGSERAGSARPVQVSLPFIGEQSTYRVPNGWVYPMLAAFRANLRQEGNRMAWRLPLAELLPLVIEDLVGVCVVEHRDNNMRPELIGKRESAYSQCYLKVELALAKLGKLY